MIPSGLELIDGYRRRELSPVEVTRSVLERIDRVNPELNAFVTLTPDLALEAFIATFCAFWASDRRVLRRTGWRG